MSDSPKRNEIEQLLSSGRTGIHEWNSMRADGKELPDLTGANLEHCDLSGCNLANVRLSTSRLRGALCNATNLDGADLSEADLTGAFLAGASINHANLSQARLGGATLSKASLIGSTLDRADMRSVTAIGANFSGASMRETHLDDANLFGSIVDSNSSLHAAHVKGCKIDRFTLEYLKDYGGLSRGQLATMHIRDAVKMMRGHYSGVAQWVHIIATTLFVAPYVVFLLRLSFFAKLSWFSTAKTIPVWLALMRFIYNGGIEWKLGWHVQLLPFLSFLWLLNYNIIRCILLWKTKSLELESACTGLPSNFSFEQNRRWWNLFQFASIGFWMNVLIVLMHTFHFLQQTIPVADV